MNDGMLMVAIVVAVSFTMAVGVHLGIKIDQNRAIQNQCITPIPILIEDENKTF